MRILICGGRKYGYKTETNYREKDMGIFNSSIDIVKSYHPTVIIEGGAKGGDEVGKLVSQVLKIKHLRFPAKWEEHGKAAGHIRNQQMLDEGKPDLVIAFPGGKGTSNMVNRALQSGVDVVDLRGGLPNG